MDKKGLAHDLASFDGEPIYRGDALFGRWLNERTQSQAARNVTFFNLIALHDGNRYVASRQIAPYKERLKTLLDQLDDFMTTLEQSGRKVAVVMVPEHGAALTGDKMQMAGLRDIPSPSITLVPVGVALLGTKAPHEATRNVDTPQQLPGGIRNWSPGWWGRMCSGARPLIGMPCWAICRRPRRCPRTRARW